MKLSKKSVPATVREPRPVAVPAASTHELEPGARDVRARLLASGASPAFAEWVVRKVEASGARGAFAIDAAARVIQRAFSIMPSPRRARGAGAPHALAFVGPTGAGKTTTLAKLGRRMRAGGRPLAFASLDPVSAGALERAAGLDADVDRSELPLLAVRGASDLKRLAKSTHAEALLIDTPGLSPRDTTELDTLARELERAGKHMPLDVFLVLPASSSRSALRLASEAYERLAPTAVILTKLDETTEPAAPLEAVLKTRHPVAFLCDGQDARANLLRPVPDHFVDLLLRGRLS